MSTTGTRGAATDSPGPREKTAATGGNGRKEPAKFTHHIDEVSEDAHELMGSLEDTVQDVSSYVREQLEQRPYTTMAAVAGLGFVLGGGLTPRVGATLVRLGGRVITTAVLRELTRNA